MRSYRPNVAIIVTDGQERVLLCQRLQDAKDIQTVQGGIDPGEIAQEAAARELHEELGIRSDQYTFREALLNTYRYDWPLEVQKKLAHTGFIGQEQTFFLAEVDPDTVFVLDAYDREFEKVWWDSPEALAMIAWPPKRPGLKAALVAFGLLNE